MTIHLDTSALMSALAGPRSSLGPLNDLVAQGHRLSLSTIVLYEWLRGPRTLVELQAQEDLFPRRTTVPFDSEAADAAAALYSKLPRVRGRDLDLAIAACALTNGAALWTLNPDDFADIPGLRLM